MNPKTPLISVIILTYNHEDYIAKAIEGVYMQNTNIPIELIVSNDCSSDNTELIIQELIKQCPKNIDFKYFKHEKNLGATPNFYWALKQATGDYLTFCEGDDYWCSPEKLQTQYDFLLANPDYSMCFHQVENIFLDGTKNTLFSKVENKDYSMLDIYQHWIVHTTSVFMRADVLQNKAAKELVKHPELLYFDTFLYLACRLSGKIRGINKTMSCYRRHEAGISNGINHLRDLRHNHLDEIIAFTYGDKIKESANWQIFSRSRVALNNCLKEGKYSLAFKHLLWILKKKGNLKVYLLKKLNP